MSKPAANPFFETDFSKYMDMSKLMDMSKMMDMTKMMDMSRIMGDMKMPNVNMDAIMASHKKNIEAITSANQMAWDNIQAFIQRQAELARQGFELATNMVQSVMSAQTPEEKIARQAEATKLGMERCVASLKELTDMMTRSHYQTIDAVSNRVCESIDEMNAIMKNGG